MENVKTINSAFRTLLATGVLGAGAIAGWLGYSTYYAQEHAAERTEQALNDTQEQLAAANKTLEQTAEELDRQRAESLKQQQELIERKAEIERQVVLIDEQVAEIGDLKVDIEEKAAEIARLDTAMRLLKVDHRLARLTVLSIKTDEATGEQFTDLQFQEITDAGEPIEGVRRFRVNGDMVYVDSWIVKFDDQYVEEADLARSTSLVLFRRIFGENRSPKDGHPLDVPGTRPTAYARGTKMSDFEKRIWDDFWGIANDPEKAHAMGIRAAHGQAVSIKAEEGKSYLIELRASDGLTIKPEEGKAATAGDPDIG